MEARFNYYGTAAGQKFVKHINSAGHAMAATGLPNTTTQLVLLRASQINGCAMCTDMHYKDAVHAGDEPERLNLVAAWREATKFTDAERAALELTEQGTRVADGAGGVSDEAWARAAEHYDEEQLAALISTIALINAYNRLNLISRVPAGDYKPGQW
ncbi:carboxymuconolactone decarboxylase family protein [Catenulispora yoronensis]